MSIDIREYQGPIVIGDREFLRGIFENYPEPVCMDAYDVLVNLDILTVLTSGYDTCYSLWAYRDGSWTDERIGSLAITTPDGTPLVVKE